MMPFFVCLYFCFVFDVLIRYRDLLIERLGADAAQYDCANMMAAGYDPPFKPVGRTNEVWLRKKD